MKSRSSIINRLTLWFIASAFALALSATIFLYLSVARTLANENQKIVLERMQALHSILERKQDPLISARRRIESEWATISLEKIFVRLRTPDGKTISISPEVPREVLEEIFPPPQSNVERKPQKMSGNSGTSYLAVSQLFVLNDYNEKFYADFAFDLTAEEAVLAQLRLRLIPILLSILLLSVIVGRRLAFSSLSPVREIAEKTGRIHPSNLHERIEMTDLPIELKQVVESFNDVLNRLELAFGRLSQFSSDIAHELRTPVNNIRGEIEVALSKERSIEEYKDVMSSSLEELQRITKITDSLLFIAKSENPETQLKKDLCELSTELEKIAEFYELPATEASVSIQVEAPPSTQIWVDRTLFQRAVGNLVSNAISHTPLGGRVVLSGRAEQNYIDVTVTDTGEGIAPEHLSKIFDRFYRADPSRSGRKSPGFGLGLPIVQGIVHLHGGKIEIKSQPGAGTAVTLHFPAGTGGSADKYK